MNYRCASRHDLTDRPHCKSLLNRSTEIASVERAPRLLQAFRKAARPETRIWQP